MPTRAELVNRVLTVLRSNLGLGETPPGSNDNIIVQWYNTNVDAIGRGAWCEMTNTYAMWNGGARDLKKGRAYTVWAAEDGQNGVNGSSWHFGTAGMMAGDQVYYDWGGEKGDVGKVDHTGTVESIVGDGTFYVLEGNISDKLQRMHRDGTYVVGYVRFDWDRLGSSPSPDPIPTANNAFLTVDGQMGPKTISRWQQVMGTPVDGVISNPSVLIRAVQNYLNAKDNAGLIVDGIGISQDGRSYKTVAALQHYLGTPQDGRLSVPVSECVKALQRRLNGNWF